MELQRLSPVFRIKKINEIELGDIHSLCECIAQYILKAEPDGRLDQILALIQKDVSEGAVWFLYRQKEIVGLLTCHVGLDLYKNELCVVDFFALNEESRCKGYAKKMADIGIAWVKQQGIKKIIFGTIRNPDAMCRLLPGPWKIDSTVISLCVA